MAYTEYSGKIFVSAAANTVCNKLVQAVIDNFEGNLHETAFVLSGCVADYFQYPTTNRVARTISFITNDSEIYNFFAVEGQKLTNLTRFVAYADRVQMTTPEDYKIEIWKHDGAIQVVGFNGVYLQDRADIPAYLTGNCNPGSFTGDETPMILGLTVFNPGGLEFYFQGWSIIPSGVYLNYNQGALTPSREVTTKIKNYVADGGYDSYTEFEIRLKVENSSGQGLQANFVDPTINGGAVYVLENNPLKVTTDIDFINLDLLDVGSYNCDVVYEVWGKHNLTQTLSKIDEIVLPVGLNVLGELQSKAVPSSLSFSHIIGGALPEGQEVMFEVPGTYTVVGAKFFTFVGNDFEDVSTPTATVFRATKPAKLKVYISSRVEDLGSGFFDEVLSVIADDPIQIPVSINVSTSQEIQVNPSSLSFEATKGVEEAKPKVLIIKSPIPFVVERPDWLDYHEDGERYIFDPVNTDNFAPGTYYGDIVLTSAAGVVSVPVTYKVNANGFTDLLQNEINFTLDAIPIRYASKEFKTYIKCYFNILVYDHNGIGKTIEHVSDVPVFNGNGSFFPGSILEGLLIKINELKLFLPGDLTARVERPFQYFRSAVLNLTLEERSLGDETIKKKVFLNNYLFQKGIMPKFYASSVGLPLADGPIRVTPKSFGMLNFYRKSGIHEVSIYKNGKKYKSITHTALYNAGYGMLLDFKDHKEGDLIYIKVKDSTDGYYEKKYFVFPEGKESYHVAWVTANEQIEMLECTGALTIGSNYESIENAKFLNLVDLIEIMDIRKTQRVNLNSGWLLKDNFRLIDSIARSKKAWLILDNRDEPIEMVPQSKSLSNFDSDQALYSYELTFKINPKHDYEVYSR